MYIGKYTDRPMDPIWNFPWSRLPLRLAHDKNLSKEES